MAHQHKQGGQSALAPANGEDNGEQGREVFSRPALCSTGRMLFTYPPTGFSHQNAADAIKMLSSLSLPSSSLLVEHFHGGLSTCLRLLLLYIGGDCFIPEPKLFQLLVYCTCACTEIEEGYERSFLLYNALQDVSLFLGERIVFVWPVCVPACKYCVSDYLLKH